MIGRQVRLKYLPELEFEEDITFEQARRIDELIAATAWRRGGRVTVDFAPRGGGAVGATDVALACHVNPDADALGSMLGLSAFLRVARRAHDLLVSERTAGATTVGRDCCPARTSWCRRGRSRRNRRSWSRATARRSTGSPSSGRGEPGRAS